MKYSDRDVRNMTLFSKRDTHSGLEPGLRDAIPNGMFSMPKWLLVSACEAIFMSMLRGQISSTEKYGQIFAGESLILLNTGQTTVADS